ncbi:MAG: HAD-IIB family hydrolase [Proteobacteria bacterium]|nr:HAD-IIB family hydrolase [Pseudomonadota bacterium]
MIPSISCISSDQIRHITGVFFDIDDTFSSSGKILPSAYTALWQLKHAGLKVVPITGRPAGWCDHIARMWPVDAVVGENGAFYFRVDEQKGRFVKRFVDDDITRIEKRKRLIDIGAEVLNNVPGTALASDQNYREADLAIDFCEDVPRLGWDDIDRICAIFGKYGATYKVSSIHVNGWFGDYSKLDMTRVLAHELWNMELEKEKDRFVYFGDSPNDEPMFRFFPFSIGVKNVLNFTDRMRFLPAFVTTYEGGEGFAEAVRMILEKRG